MEGTSLQEVCLELRARSSAPSREQLIKMCKKPLGPGRVAHWLGVIWTWGGLQRDS